MLKLFVDDEREPPSHDWVVLRDPKTAWEVIYTMLDHNIKIDEISLDHDFGIIVEHRDMNTIENGYDLLVKIEGYMMTNYEMGHKVHIPNITVHSQNPACYDKMLSAIRIIMLLKE